jgi:hypothetical protein
VDGTLLYALPKLQVLLQLLLLLLLWMAYIIDSVVIVLVVVVVIPVMGACACTLIGLIIIFSLTHNSPKTFFSSIDPSKQTQTNNQNTNVNVLLLLSVL